MLFCSRGRSLILVLEDIDKIDGQKFFFDNLKFKKFKA